MLTNKNHWLNLVSIFSCNVRNVCPLCHLPMLTKLRTLPTLRDGGNQEIHAVRVHPHTHTRYVFTRTHTRTRYVFIHTHTHTYTVRVHAHTRWVSFVFYVFDVVTCFLCLFVVVFFVFTVLLNHKAESLHVLLKCVANWWLGSCLPLFLYWASHSSLM